MRRSSLLPLAALLAVSMLPGCALSVAKTVAKAETARLERLRSWQAGLVGRDCAGLEAAARELEAARDDLVDHDQRSDHLREVMEAQGCPLPATLTD